MQPKKVYIDTNVFKFSAIQLQRFHPRVQTIDWGGKSQEVIVRDFVNVNPNLSIKNPELRAEADLLFRLAVLGKQGKIKYVTNVETLIESWNIPNMNSKTGKFYGAPFDIVDAPISYSRVLSDWDINSSQAQFKFLSAINHKQFLELQKMTGAYQGEGKLNRNQLVDAFQIWCAEHNCCEYFLTLDFKLIRMLRSNKKSSPVVEVVKPSELSEHI